MERNPFNYRSYFKHLSPFGQKVLQVLVEDCWSEKNYNMNTQSRCNYVVQSAATGFMNSRYSRHSIALPNSFEEKNNFSRKKCNLTFLEKKIASTSDLLNVKSRTEKNKQDVLSRDDLVTSATGIHEKFCDTDGNNNFDDNIGNIVYSVSDTNKFALDRQPLPSSFAPGHDQHDITWSNMFDSELFEVNNENGKVLNSKDGQYLLEQSLNPLDEAFKTPNIETLKRKSAKKIEKNSKKVKKTNPKAEIFNRKQKFTTAVENWLDDVERADDNPENEDLPKAIQEKQNIFFKSNLISKKETKKITHGKQPEQTNSIDLDLAKESTKKKVVQAQLANKDGKMKFGQPKNFASGNGNSASPAIQNKKLNKEAVKEKNVKNKFIAPIKSLIPVKDMKYNIIRIEGSNFSDNCAVPLDKIENAEIVVTLVYKNGFCQLNGCYTEDSCVPKGLIISDCNEDNTFYYFTGIDEHIWKILSQILKKNVIICYEGKNVLIFLSHFNINFKPKSIEDAKIGGALLDPENPPETFSDLQKLIGFSAEFTIATDCALQKAAWYTDLLRTCSAKLRTLLVENSLWNVFANVEMRLLPIIADMERIGIAVDMDKLKEMEQLLIARLKVVEQECYLAAGRVFPLNSTPRLRALLYDDLQLDTKGNVRIKETTVMGAKSTSEATLRSLMSVHPLPKLILEYRHLHKAHTTFITGIAQHVKDGVVKPTWNQTAAATGRIASNNPNLQAIPKAPFSLIMFPDSDDVDNPVMNFRSVYVSRAGHSLLAADFRHVECRVFAHAAADAALQAALDSPEDLFRLLAAKWLGKPVGEVSEAERERTKRVVYASLYGCGARKLADVLDVPYDHALQVLASFNRTFPSLKAFGRSVVDQCARSGGRISTLCGRTRTFKNINSQDFAAKAQAERQAVNFIVQGSAADVCKRAMVVSAERLARAGLRATLVLQIHDELVWEVHDQDLQTVAEVVSAAMEGCGRECGAALRLPVARAAGTSWADMTPL